MFAELLDVGEDVVPPAAVEAGGVLAKLVEDLMHLERGDIVSIRTVALMVPLGMPSSSWADSKTSFQSLASRWLSSFGR